MLGNEPHPLCLLAANSLQQYLNTQQEWKHNFGLAAHNTGTVIGKMFGVLVVETPQHEIGYLSAFSGKMAGTNQYTKFVPPVFDLLTENSFLNLGMQELARLSGEINTLKLTPGTTAETLVRLKRFRKAHSVALQTQIFEHYHFLNQAGAEKSLVDIFKGLTHKNPPAGAGECAGIKLLQYAFQHKMKPVALAEFWWGQSPKSDTWKHGHFYPCCREKCEPILEHMLLGLDCDYL